MGALLVETIKNRRQQRIAQSENVSGEVYRIVELDRELLMIYIIAG